MRKSVLVTLVVLGILGLVDLYLAFSWSPPEKAMGDLVRIMYFHVSSAWIAFFSFFVTFVFAILYLIRRKQLLDSISVCSAEIGIVFTTLTLFSGSIWGKAVWQTWWTWDPRLTTTLILWFLFVGYMLLRGTIAGLERRARIGAIYAIIAFGDVPIIHMSVTWWRSIHPTVIDNTGFHMPGKMVLTLMFGFVVFLLLYFVLLYLRVRVESQKIALLKVRESLRRLRARIEGGV
jgi:heme exporter protein C